MTLHLSTVPQGKYKVKSNDKVIAYLYTLLQLPKGWHYGEGIAPSIDMVLRAQKIIISLREAGAEVIEVFPTIEGAIIANGYHKNETIQITCLKNNNYDFLFEVNDEDVLSLENIVGSDILKNIEKHKWQSPTLSGSRTQDITLISKADLNRPLFQTLKGVGFPCSTWNVQNRSALHYVSI